MVLLKIFFTNLFDERSLVTVPENKVRKAIFIKSFGKFFTFTMHGSGSRYGECINGFENCRPMWTSGASWNRDLFCCCCYNSGSFGYLVRVSFDEEFKFLI